MDIAWNEGIERIEKFGLVPFFQRIDAAFQNGMKQDYSIPSSQYIKAYDTIFTMCIQREPYNFSEQLYKFQENEIKKYCITKINKILQDAENAYNGNKSCYLQSWCNTWKRVTFAINGIHRYFQYLDRFFVPNSEDIYPVRSNGYVMFFKHSFTQNYARFTRNILLNWIENIRDRYNNINIENINIYYGDSLSDNKIIRDSINVFSELHDKLIPRIQSDLFNNSVDIKKLVNGYIHDTIDKHIEYYSNYIFPKEFHVLIVKYHGPSDSNIYDKFWHNHFIFETKDYYSIRSKQWIQQRISLTQYFKLCENVVEQEMDHMRKWGIFRTDGIGIINMIKYELHISVQMVKLIEYNKGINHMKYFTIDVLECVLLFYNQYIETKEILDREIINIFNYYILKSTEKQRLDTIYEILDIYQYFIAQRRFHKLIKINNEIKVLFRGLIKTQRYYLNNLMIHIWDYTIINFDYIASVNTYYIDNIIDLIIGIYDLMDNNGQNEFGVKYIDRLKIRTASKRYICSSKCQYLERKMLNKLNNMSILMFTMKLV